MKKGEGNWLERKICRLLFDHTCACMCGIIWLLVLLSAVVTVGGLMTFTEPSSFDWTIASEQPSINSDGLSAALKVSDPIAGTEQSTPPRTVAARAFGQLLMFSNLNDDTSTTIFTPTNVKDMCEIENVMLDHADYKDFCVIDGAGKCVPQSNSVVSFFYPSNSAYQKIESWGYAGRTCTLLSQADVDAGIATIQAGLDDPNTRLRFGFHVTQTELASGIAYATRSSLNVGGPVGGYTSVDDDTFEQMPTYRPFQVAVETALFAKFNMDNQFFKSGYVDPATTAHMKVRFYSLVAQQEEFARVVNGDLTFTTISMLFVFIYIWVHTGSLWLTSTGMLQIMLSLPVAFFIYRVVFQITFYTQLHILAIFLVLGVGADDIFVFVDGWKQSKGLYRDPYERLVYTYRRAVRAVFNTSFTTAFAFCATAVSPVMPVSSFGIYAALAIVLNYVFVVSATPCEVLVYYRWWSKEGKRDRALAAAEAKAAEEAALAEAAKPAVIEAAAEATPEPAAEAEETADAPAETETEAEAGAEAEADAPAAADDDEAADTPAAEADETEAEAEADEANAEADEAEAETEAAPDASEAEDSKVAEGTDVGEVDAAVADKAEAEEAEDSKAEPEAEAEQAAGALANNVVMLEGAEAEAANETALAVPGPIAPARKERRVEWFYGSVYAPFMLKRYKGVKVVSLAIIAIFTVYFTLSFLWASRLQTPESEEEWFAKSHMFTGLNDYQKGTFQSATASSYADMRLAWGVAGVDRSEYVVWEPSKKRGAVVWDPSFDLTTTAAQQHFLSVCQQLRTATCDIPSCQSGTDPRTLVLEARVDCFLEDYQTWYMGRNGGAPMPTGATFVSSLIEFRNNNSHLASNIGIVGGELKYAVVSFTSSLLQNQPFGTSEPMYRKMEAFVAKINSEAPAGVDKAFQESLWWSWMKTEEGLVDGMFFGLGLSFPVAFLVLCAATDNIILALYAVICIAGIVAAVLGFGQNMLGWALGFGESIAAVVVIGFSVDYVVHLGHMYAEAGKPDRDSRLTHSAKTMGVTVLAGAITTFGAGVVMLLCQMVFFTKMALYISLTIAFSFSTAMGPFMGLCAMAGPEGDFGKISVMFNKATRYMGWSKAPAKADTEEA